MSNTNNDSQTLENENKIEGEPENMAAVDEIVGELEEAVEAQVEASDESLAEQLKNLQAEVAEHKDQVLRARAEMDNLRRRSERDVQNAHKFANEGILNELLQVRDSLELGVKAAQDEKVGVEHVREGNELTLKLLGDVMERFGIEQINPQGEAFDPELHQAVSMQPSADVAPNMVLTVIQTGYKLNGRLMRPAMVVVAQGK